MTISSTSPSPRPHQVDTLTDLVRAFAVHDKVQLRMACESGKTLVGRWHAEASDARQVLVLVPSLALLTQTLQEWRRARGWPFEALVVCSDPTTSAGAAERSGGDEVDDEALEPDWCHHRGARRVRHRHEDQRHHDPEDRRMTITVDQAAAALTTAAATAHWDDGSLLVDVDETVLRERLAPALAAALSETLAPPALVPAGGPRLTSPS